MLGKLFSFSEIGESALLGPAAHSPLVPRAILHGLHLHSDFVGPAAVATLMRRAALQPRWLQCCD